MAPAKKDTIKKKEYGLDIKKTLIAADIKDFDYYSRLSDDEIKAFVPLVVMRWLSSVGNNSKYAEHYLLMTNELINIGFWELYKHPELQWKLMASAGSNFHQYHQWIAGSKKITSNKLNQFILSLYPMINDFELSIIKNKLTKELLTQKLKDMGLPDDEIKPILDEFKKFKESIGNS